MQIMFTELFWGRLWRRGRQRRWVLRLQEIERRHRADAGRRGEGALLQLPTDGVVHEEVVARVPVGGIREAGEEEGGQEGNSGFFVVTKRKIMINLMGCGQRLLGLLFQQDSSKQNAFLMFCLQENWKRYQRCNLLVVAYTVIPGKIKQP